MPRDSFAFGERYGHGIGEPLALARSRIDDMLIELLAMLYPEAATREVSADRLRAAGFDPDAPAPDELDYL